jgi:hypothetical protein
VIPRDCRDRKGHVQHEEPLRSPVVQRFQTRLIQVSVVATVGLSRARIAGSLDRTPMLPIDPPFSPRERGSIAHSALARA